MFFFNMPTYPIMAHFTVTGANEAGVDLVLIQPFLLYYVNHVVVMLTFFFEQNFHKKKKEVCIKTRSTSASRSLKGWDTTPTAVKWSISLILNFVTSHFSFL